MDEARATLSVENRQMFLGNTITNARAVMNRKTGVMGASGFSTIMSLTLY